MATPTYDLIETTTLTSSASSVTFSSITQDYRDLVLVIDYLGSGAIRPQLRFNGDGATVYSGVRMTGDGSTATSGTNNTSVVDYDAPTGSATVKSLVTYQFLDYSATDKHKSMLVRANNSALGTTAFAGRYASTTAISSITIFASSGSFATTSSFSLYGIAS